MLPEDKQAFLKERHSTGEIIAFIGDGVNDSPSLATAGSRDCYGKWDRCGY